MWASLEVVRLFCATTFLAVLVSAQDDVVPDARIEALYPRGLRVSIPDSDGVELFAFHANINKPLYQLAAGEISVDVTRKKDGRWTYSNNQKRLKPGDVINYWTYVQVDGRGYRLDDQTFQVKELVDPLVNQHTTQAPQTPSPLVWTGNSQSNPSGVIPESNRPPQSDPYRPNRPVPSAGHNTFPAQQRPPTDNIYGQRPNPNDPYAQRPPPADPYPQRPAAPVDPYPQRPAAPVDPYPQRPAPVDVVYPNNNDPYSQQPRPQDPYSPQPQPNDPYAQRPTYQRPSSNVDSLSNHHNYPHPHNTNPYPVNQNVNTRPNPIPLESGDRFNTPSASTQDCVLSQTTVNGKPACKDQVVFEEKWDTLDRRRWEHEVKISGHPDFEFCIYARHPENSWVSNNRLHLKPTLTDDKYGENFVHKGKLELDDCTAGPLNSDTCKHEARFSYILPPTIASRINTKRSFSFKYGILEVRAKLPLGDWIYPELWLLPRDSEYGPGLSSGRVHLAMSRGNQDLQSRSGEDISSRHLEAGALAGGNGVGSAGARKKLFHRDISRGAWADNFHNYTLLWTPETLVFSVDGVELGVARPEALGGLLRSDGTSSDPWTNGSKIAPFDKEFYISLGVAVGGIHAFPDECRNSAGVEKPWKNTAAKALIDFWKAKNDWYSTWRDNSELTIESVRVSALSH